MKAGRENEARDARAFPSVTHLQRGDRSLPLQPLNPWAVLPPTSTTSVENSSDFFMYRKYTLLTSMIFKIGGIPGEHAYSI